MLNNFVEKKENFSSIKTKFLKVLKNGIFPKGLTHALGPKMPNFSFI